jgi:hypothetical protein
MQTAGMHTDFNSKVDLEVGKGGARWGMTMWGKDRTGGAGGGKLG